VVPRLQSAQGTPDARVEIGPEGMDEHGRGQEEHENDRYLGQEVRDDQQEDQRRYHGEHQSRWAIPPGAAGEAAFQRGMPRVEPAVGPHLVQRAEEMLQRKGKQHGNEWHGGNPGEDGRNRNRAASGPRKRSQSKAGPGSVVRPGATSLWPTMCPGVRRGRCDIRRRTRSAAVPYCAGSYGSSSQPSNSMPMEKSLHAVRPQNADWPACHARRVNGTYWVIRPARSTSTCAETRSAAIPRKYGWASGSSVLVK